VNGTTQHDTISAVYHWPLNIWGDSEGYSCIECDYCGATLWDSDSPGEVNLDSLYKQISGHRIDKCPEAPEASAT
jgi:hypothetical protein